MLFNLLALVLILMITLYLATQGTMSALLALVTATFASILSMGLMEASQGLISGWRPDYARGVTLLLLFLLSFSACRIVADMCVPKNIKLPLMVNRIVGGFLGFFTGMVVIGTTIIGIEMLPLHTVMLGYDRFPEGMQAGHAAPTNVWLWPERFTLMIWNGASGRGLGGAAAFSDVHPDIDVESYGYRDTVQYQSKHAMLKEFLEVPTAWMSGDVTALATGGIRLAGLDPSARIVVVRATVKKGDKPEHGTYDSDNSYFRVTPTQVRLVTDKGRQYYPVGYYAGHGLQLLTDGPPEKGQENSLVEDYSQNDSEVTLDWVFQIRDSEMPKWFEMKQLARVDLTDILQNKPEKPLAVSKYPQLSYLKDLATLDVTVNNGGKPVDGASVYLIESGSPKRDMSSEVDSAYSKLVGITSGEVTWTGDTATELKGFISSAQREGNQQYKPKENAETISWDMAIRMMVGGELQPDSQQNYNNIPEYINNTMIPKVVKSAVLLDDKTGPDGRARLSRIPPRSFVVLVTYKSEEAYYIWMTTENIAASSNPKMVFETGASSNGTGPMLTFQRNKH